MKSDTPRTDVGLFTVKDTRMELMRDDRQLVDVFLCRTIEKELTAARAEIELLKTNLEISFRQTEQAVQDRADEHKRLIEQRDRAWQTIAEIKRDIMEDETFGDVVIKLWQEPLDEAIEQRDRLAEALRECLERLEHHTEFGALVQADMSAMHSSREALQSLTPKDHE